VLTKAAPALLPAHDRELAEGAWHGREPASAAARAESAQEGREPLDALRELLSTPAGPLLVGVSVYREPADRNAVLFQVGRHDWAAARAHDIQGPTPPYHPPADLTELTTAGADAGLLSLSGAEGAGGIPALFMAGWIADELHRILVTAGRHADLMDAHRQAAEFWKWRATAWPQERQADIHDLLEARQHLLHAGDTGEAGRLTGVICAQLRVWGDLDQEAELVRATVDQFPSPSADRARWLHELGVLAQLQGDHAAAERRYLRAVKMFAEVGEPAGVARGYESLGVLAQALGDYRKAERRYREAAGAHDDGSAAAWTAAAQEKADEAAGSAWPVPANLGQAGPVPTEAALAGGALAGPALAEATSAEAAPGKPPWAELTSPGSAEPAQASLPQPEPPGASPAQESPVLAGPAGPQAAEPQPTSVPGAEPAGVPLSSVLATEPAGVPSSSVAATEPAGGLSSSALAARSAGAEPAPRGRAGWLRPRRRTAAVAAGSLALVAVAATAVALARGAPGSASASSSAAAPSQSLPGGQRTLAAIWVARQVSRSAVVACDPAMYAALRDHGIPAGNLLLLGPGAGSDPLGSDIIVGTAAIRSEFGGRLAGVYAPVVAASFGRGSGRIEIRVTAPDGAAAYQRAMTSDQQARRTAGVELTQNGQLSVTPAAQRALDGGRVDSRLLTTIAALAQSRRLHVIGFGDSGPGADPALPLRSAEISATGPAASTGALGPLLAFLRAQRAPYLAASMTVTRLRTGQAVLRFAFGGPSPLGLLTAGGSAPAR
jgi:tetratricopeptide (TPR) repeat protein